MQSRPLLAEAGKAPGRESGDGGILPAGDGGTRPREPWAGGGRAGPWAVLRLGAAEALRGLRMAARWLRYTLEFGRGPLGPDAGPLSERVVGLQDHLGFLHDADVAAALARQFLVDRSGDLSEPETAAIGRYLMDRERELGRLRRTVGGAWRRVAGLGFRRSLGRVVAGL